MRYARLLFLAMLLWSATLAHAGRRTFEWDPVAPEDWNCPDKPDSTPWKACVLLERVTFDETGFMDDRVDITVYRRVRICSAEARSFGDVVVPYFREGQKVDKVYGRTILRDGTEVPLQKDQVFERELVQTDRRRLMQTAFSLPGITDDCIIEYSYVVRLESFLGVWRFQHEVPVRHAELHWQLFPFQSLGFLALIFGGMPNYVLLNSDQEVQVEKHSSEKDGSEITFRLDDIPPLVAEPFALPEAARKVQLHCYYGSGAKTKDYWDEEVVYYQQWADRFCERDKEVTKVAQAFDTLPTQEEKIAAAYDFVQSRIRNLTYDPTTKKPKMRECANDVVKEGCGYAAEMNLLFYDLLKQMHIDAHVALTVDREERLFIRDAKYWQFDDLVVAVRVRGSQFAYYSPGDAGLPVGLLRWQNEGVTALLCNVVIDQFQATPFSAPEQNRVDRRIAVRVNPQGGAEGECRATAWGQAAREEKLLRVGSDSAAAAKKRSEQIKETLGAQEVRGLSLTACDNFEFPVEEQCKVQYALPLAPASERWEVNPFVFMADAANPFTAGTRVSPIVFPYAQLTAEEVDVAFPAGWTPATVPADIKFVNEIGSCSVHYAWSDSVLSVTREFRLNRPHIEADKYAAVQKLFDARAQFADRSLLFKH